MPFDRPTLSALRDSTRQDFTARLPGADSLLRQSNIRVSADVISGALHMAYGRIEWVSKQVIPDSAEAQYLERWCDIFGLTRKGATRATGSIRFTGTDGAPVPIGTVVQSGNLQASYRTIAAGLIAGGQAIVAAEAVDAGADANNLSGVIVNLVNAVPGVVSTATLQGEMAGGADEESDPELLDRLLFEIQKPAHGGNRDDYFRWALEVPGVTRVWVSGNELGGGTVLVRFMMDDVRADHDGIPQGDPAPAYSDDLLAVYQHLEPLRPVTAQLYVAAPVAVPVDITIANLQPNTALVQAAVIAELKDEFLRDAVPGGTIFQSWLWAAVSTASGERSHTIQAPAADVVMGVGQIPVLGTVTFV